MLRRNDQVFNIYDDINSGGTAMTKQQLRRAAFWGPYIRLLDELAVLPNTLAVRLAEVVDEAKVGFGVVARRTAYACTVSSAAPPHTLSHTNTRHTAESPSNT